MFTEEELDELIRDLILHRTAVRQLEGQLKKHILAAGGFEARGLHGYTTQTITDMFPVPKSVFDTLPRFIRDDEWPAYCLRAFEAIPTRSFKGFVRKLPVGEMVLAVLDNSGALVTLFGKPTTGIRGTKPKDGRVHILEPGDTPLVGDYVPAEGEDEE